MLALKGVSNIFWKYISKIYLIHLSRLTFSITPDEALVETRRELVIEKIIGSILEKMKTFGHIYDYK